MKVSYEEILALIYVFLYIDPWLFRAVGLIEVQIFCEKIQQYSYSSSNSCQLMIN